MYYRLLIIITITIFSCKKELDINDFSDDFDSYEGELRIEALMLPTDNTAIIRIDRSTRLDEGLNDEGYYNCVDDDGDWNYYYCNSTKTSFENRCDCEKVCSENNIDNCDNLEASLYRCNIHLYKCDTEIDSLVTFEDKNSCICENGECVTDDVGKDGKAAFDSDNDGKYNTISFGGDIPPDEGEGDGLPSCGEPKVDEFDEVLPGIHIDNCQVYITQAEDTCFFEFHEDGGQFYDEPKKNASILDAELVHYGAWRPNNTCEENFNFTYYDSLYTFGCNCSQDGFNNLGLITASDILRRPPVFYDAGMDSLIVECSFLTEKEQVYNCLKSNEVSDTLTFVDLRKYVCYKNGVTPLYYNDINNCINECIEGECLCSEEKIKNDSLLQFIADTLKVNLEQIINPQFNCATLSESKKYQIVQYMYDARTSDWVYFHGHPAFVNQNFLINNNLCLFGELILAEQYRNDCKVEASFFKYDVFTFSSGYENYYFYDQLDLADPVRTNLRYGGGNANTVMGAFGAMVRNSIYYEIISADSLLGE